MSNGNGVPLTCFEAIKLPSFHFGLDQIHTDFFFATLRFPFLGKDERTVLILFLIRKLPLKNRVGLSVYFQS